MSAGGLRKTCNFTQDEARLLVFLYENANEPQETEKVIRECNLTRKQISSACNSIRSKMHRRIGLDYTQSECREILPIYRHGTYILNIFPEETQT